MSRNPTVRALNVWSRRLHRWGSILIALPVSLVLCTGILLQVKKQVAWIQPPTQRGGDGPPEVSFEQILEAARRAPEAGVGGWDDVDRLDVRLDRGLVKVVCKSRWEIQVDTTTGEVLQVAYRRSDLIESLHDGSFFHDQAKLLIFLPSGAVLLGLWATGMYLWALPIAAKRAGRRRRAAAGMR